MRILMLSTYYLPKTIGGLELHIHHLSHALMRLGHHVELVHFDLGVAGRTRFLSGSFKGLTVHRILVPPAIYTYVQKMDRLLSDTPLGFLLRFLKKSSYLVTALRARGLLRQMVQTHQVDLVHQHDFFANLITTKSLARIVPTVLTNHTGEFLFLRRNPATRRFLKPLLAHFKAIIGPSHELCDLGFPRDNVYYIPNGFDEQQLKPLSDEEVNELRRQKGFDRKDFLVLCPRRWAPTKGIKYLVEALKIIAGVSLGSRKMYCLMAGSDSPMFP